MIATHTEHAQKENLSLNLAETHPTSEADTAVSNVQSFNAPAQLFLPNRAIIHSPKSGLNPLVDAAAYLFSVLGKLKHVKSYRQLNKLQAELIQELNGFQEAVKSHNYNPEYIIVCRYILCATFDEIITNTAWGGQGQWDSYSLLAAFNQDIHHQDKFFSIMERAIKEPSLYIDLMELMYICLSMGYKGQYRTTEHSQFQLEQIINNLYKHIRAYRGSFSKTLSPTPLKSVKPSAKTTSQNNTSVLFIFFVTACIIMTIFVSLGYLMDVISNEAYTNISQVDKPSTQKSSE